MAVQKYDGFISYSTAADGQLAPKIQDGLEQLARPWNKRRALKVFRDKDDLAASSHLERTLKTELEQSGTLIFLASESAAKSEWCNDELEYWIDERPANELVVVLTDGSLTFHKGAEHPLDLDSTAAPPALERLSFEPLYIDMRRERAMGDDLDFRSDPEFRAKLAKISAALHTNKTGEDWQPRNIDSKDLTEHRKFRRLRRIVMISLTVITVVAIGLGVLARRGQVEAERLADEATSRALAVSSEAEQARNAELAALLALEANKVDDTPEASRSLYGAVTSRWIRTLAPPPQGDFDLSASFSADGTQVVTAGMGGVVVLDAVGTDAPITLTRGGASVAAFDGDGSHVISAGFGAEGVVLWDVETGASESFGSFWGADVDRAGTQVVTSGEGVVVWDVGTSDEGTALADAQAIFGSVEFSPNNEQVVATADDAVLVWDIETGEEMHRLRADRPSFAVFDETGTSVLFVDLEGVAVWNLRDGERTDVDANPGLRTASFDPSGSRVVTAGNEGAIIWDVTGVDPPTVPTTGLALSADFNDDGTQVVTMTPAGVMLWNTAQEFAPTTVTASNATSAEFDTDGHRVVTSYGDDRGISVWDLRGGRQPVTLAKGAVLGSVSFDGEGDWIISEQGFWYEIDGTGQLKFIDDYDDDYIWAFASDEQSILVVGFDDSVTVSLPGEPRPATTEEDVAAALADPSRLVLVNGSEEVFVLDAEQVGIPVTGNVVWAYISDDGTRAVTAH